MHKQKTQIMEFTIQIQSFSLFKQNIHLTRATKSHQGAMWRAVKLDKIMILMILLCDRSLA